MEMMRSDNRGTMHTIILGTMDDHRLETASEKYETLVEEGR